LKKKEAVFGQAEEKKKNNDLAWSHIMCGKKSEM